MFFEYHLECVLFSSIAYLLECVLSTTQNVFSMCLLLNLQECVLNVLYYLPTRMCPEYHPECVLLPTYYNVF